MGLTEHLRYQLERLWQAVARWAVPQVLYELDLSHSAPRYSCEVCDLYWDVLLGEGWQERERPHATTLTAVPFGNDSPSFRVRRVPGRARRTS